MSNTVAGRRQFDNSQECIAKKRQWCRHANENTPEQNASIDFTPCVNEQTVVLESSTNCLTYGTVPWDI